MATTITKLSNGAISIDYGDGSGKLYFNNLENVKISTAIGPIGSLKNSAYISIQYTGGSIGLTNITTVNGVAAPSNINTLLDLLAREVFNFGGGGGVIGATAASFTILSNPIWDRSLYENAQLSLTSNSVLSIINDTNDFSYGVLYLTTNDYTITLPGISNDVVFNSGKETTLVYNKREGIYRWASNGVIDDGEVAIPNTLPVITLQPVSLEDLTIGENFELSVDFTGVPTPEVIWQGSGDGVNFNDIPGLTQKTFSKVGADNDDGYYRAKVSNSEGTVYSSAAHIVVSTADIVPTDPNMPAEFMTLGSSTGVVLTEAPEDYTPVEKITENNINPMIFSDVIPANEDGFMQVAMAPYNVNESLTFSCYIGFSETNVLTDVSNPTLDMKVGFIPYDVRILVKDNNMFFGPDLESRYLPVEVTRDSTRLRIKRTGSVYTLEKSLDYGASFQVIYTFTNYNYTGALYVVAGLIDGPKAKLSYAQIGGAE